MIHEISLQAMQYFDVFFFPEIIVCLHIYIIVLVLVAQSSPMLCNPTDCSLPVSLAMGFSSQE